MFFAACLGLAYGSPALTPHADAAAATFKVLAFYSGTYDAAHIDFEKEANPWFPQFGGAERLHLHGYEQLEPAEHLLTTAQAQVVMFLDDSAAVAARSGPGSSATWTTAAPSSASTSRRTTTRAVGWPWFNNDAPRHRARSQSNTWGPTASHAEDREPHPPVAVNTAGDVPARRSVSGTAGRTTCGRTRTSRSWPRSTRRSFPVGDDPSADLDTAATTRSCGRTRTTR